MFGSIDSKQLIYLPGWVKLILVAVLATTLGAAIFVAVSFIGVPDKSDWIIMAVAGAQLAATVLIASLVLFFSQTDDSIRSLDRKADQFLRRVVPAALSRVSAPGTAAAKLSVEIGGARDIFGYNYRLRGADGFTFKMWVGLNVRRLIVIYFVDAGQQDVTKMKDLFRFTFGGAEAVGYKSNYEEGMVNGERILAIWLSTSTADQFLTSPLDKIFWAQDIAMMTQSFLRTALRNADIVQLNTISDPAPL